jgi:hypothetical protein
MFILNKTFQLFTEYMKLRFMKNVLCTEDSVRYTFFASLLKTTTLNPEDIILEYPHPSIRGAEVDTVIPCLFRRFRPPIPEEAGRLFRLKSAT